MPNVKQIDIKQLDGTYITRDIGVDHNNVDGLEEYVYNIQQDSNDLNKIKITKGINGDSSKTTTYSIDLAMTGATSTTNGMPGLVPAPSIGDENKFLKGDGTWTKVEGGGGGSTIEEIMGTTTDYQTYIFNHPSITESANLLLMTDEAYDNKFYSKSRSGSTYTVVMNQVDLGRPLKLIVLQ